MKNFQISKTYIEAIKNQALSNKNEIYGWLIGYEDQEVPKVLSIIECKQYSHQTIVSAKPKPQEFQEISSVMPQGIGPIGIYHSHPFTGEIFHSHIDDATLVNFSNYFPKCLSIVTNGKQINFYQMGKNSEAREIEGDFTEPKVPKFLSFYFKHLFKLSINSKEFESLKENPSKLKIKLINHLKEYLEGVWEDIILSTNSKTISRKEKVANYLTSELQSNQIRLKIPFTFNMNNPEEIRIDIDDSNSNPIDKVSFKLDVETNVPIYTSNKKSRFEDLTKLIKTEIIDNNLLPRLYNCILDIKHNDIILPDEFYINFFGFYIKLLYFDNNYDDENLSTDVYIFLLKRLSTFESFEYIKLSKNEKNQIKSFFNDVKDFSNHFNWKINIFKKIITLSDILNL